MSHTHHPGLYTNLTKPWTERVAWAAKIAASAHQDQVDQQGQPYILHPMRIALAIGGDSRTIAIGPKMVVAFLHDVLEDTVGPKEQPGPWDALIRLKMLGEWGSYGHATYDALLAITHLPRNEPNERYIQRVSADPIAREVKIEDIYDNLLRLNEVGFDYRSRRRMVKKYIDALNVLITPLERKRMDANGEFLWWKPYEIWLTLEEGREDIGEQTNTVPFPTIKVPGEIR